MIRVTACAVLASLFLATMGCYRKGPTETLWLGHVAPMTGPEKSAGDHARQGIRIAVEEAIADADNLVLGRKVAVRHADAKSDARDAEAEAVRLVSVNRVVALLGGIDTAQAEQLARGAESAGVPVILQAPLSSPNENAWAIVPSLTRRGQVLGKFAASEKKATKVFAFADERSRAAGPVVEAFARELPKDSVPRFPFKSADELAGFLGGVTAEKPDSVLFAGSARDLPRFRAELQKVLPGIAIFFGGEESTFPGLLGDRAAGDGIYLATSYLAADDTAANQAFAKKYQEQFQELPDVNAALAYDGTRLLCEVLRKAGTINPVKLRETLQQLESFDSVTGPLTFGEDRHARRPLFVVQITNGQAVLRKRYGPDD
jgi:branched-chain amino acid transport system substrate-binding protein